ncbi:MAG: hypothetical protein ACI9YO_001995 [Gammaproteobacteria bacterium]|jgi:hypothetical protein
MLNIAKLEGSESISNLSFELILDTRNLLDTFIEKLLVLGFGAKVKTLLGNADKLIKAAQLDLFVSHYVPLKSSLQRAKKLRKIFRHHPMTMAFRTD